MGRFEQDIKKLSLVNPIVRSGFSIGEGIFDYETRLELMVKTLVQQNDALQKIYIEYLQETPYPTHIAFTLIPNKGAELLRKKMMDYLEGEST